MTSWRAWLCAGTLLSVLACGDSSSDDGMPTAGMEAGSGADGADGSTGDPSDSGASTDPTAGSSADGGSSGPMDTGGDGDATDGTTGGAPCQYPSGAVEPMTVDEVITPYHWDMAIHGDGTVAALDLMNVPCDDDPNIEWSPHDVLVFVSIPAW